MAQVPYSPVPSVIEQDRPLPSIHIDAGPQAFGAAVGQALGQAGQVTDQASNEIFQRAMAMQNLQNEADARNAQVTYMQQQGQLHADFTSKQGADAGPQALQQYSTQSDALRTSIRDSMTSPMAQKLFDNDSMTFMSRNIFNAAGHSAQQMKSYSLGTSAALMDNNANAALQNPTDELQFQAGLANQRQTALQHASDMGFAPGTPGSQDIVDKAVSGMVSARILGAARDNPAQANSWFQTALKDGSLRGQDIAKVTNTLQAQSLSMLPKQINDGINDGTSMVLGQSKVTMDRAMDAIGSFESGNNYGKMGKVVTSGMYAGQQALGKYQVMPGNLPQWLSEAGLPAMTPQQFLANPSAQDKVFATQFGKVMNAEGGNFNKAANTWFTGSANPPSGAHDDNGTTAPAYLAATNAALAKTAGIQEKVDAARGEATRLAPNTPGIEDSTEARVITTQRQDDFIQKQATAQNWNVIQEAVNSANGQTPGTIEALRASNPDVSKAIDNLAPKDIQRLQNTLKMAQSNDHTPTPERDRNVQMLTGMSQTDPEGFQKVDLYSGTGLGNLTNEQRKAMVSLQGKNLKGAAEDPNVKRALTNMAPLLDAAGLTKAGGASDDQEMNVFRGALTQQLQDLQKNTGAPPSIDQIQTMGRRLLQQSVTGKNWYGGDSTEPVYSAKPSQEQAATIRSQVSAKYPNTDLTDAQVQKIYTRSLYNQVVRKEKTPNG